MVQLIAQLPWQLYLLAALVFAGLGYWTLYDNRPKRKTYPKEDPLGHRARKRTTALKRLG